jgi:hypothetical protein
LQGALTLDNPPAIRLGCVEEAYKLGIEIAGIVSDELEERRQEMSDILLMPIDELMASTVKTDFEQYKSYCEQNNLKPSNGKVLNEYFKERGV